MNRAPHDLSESYQRQLTAACAYLESVQDGVHVRGTGYLVASDLIATCSHVVPEGRAAAPIQVRVLDREYQGQVIAQDEARDCALVRVAQPPVRATPLQLADGCAAGEGFWSVGFPITAEQSPLPLSGHVVAPRWPDRSGRSTILLYSPQVAAGHGGLLQGFSGSPVLIAGVCVGHLQSIVPDAAGAADRPYAQLGYLYACPSSAAAALAAACVRLPCPPRQPALQVPTRPTLRALISEVTSGDMNFDDFFQNHFEKLYRCHITMTMSLQQKVNILLTHANRGAVLDALRHDYPEEVSRHESNLKYELQKRLF